MSLLQKKLKKVIDTLEDLRETIDTMLEDLEYLEAVGDDEMEEELGE
jgi:hypothetical protein